MKSFQKMNEFERVATLPSITIDEIAKCLVGLSPTLLKRDIDTEKLEVISHIKMRLKRTLEEVFKANNIERITKYTDYIASPHPVDDSEKISSDLIFSIGYNCLDADETPEAIIERCSMAVQNIAITNKNNKLLSFIGGEAEKLGLQIIKNNRGAYKKDEELFNVNKLLGITLTLLAKEKYEQNNAKWIKKGDVICVEHIKEMIDLYIQENDISTNGLRASSLRAKLKSALNAIYN
ncbi:hypothetical Protein YWA314_19712 [Yersinia enterocolitica subsp. enterocolitica WA-314]|jgi:hypothetical protein|uniref:hypothetical protein n=1 Tax=Yersinia TaxID=629 RepID=UPI0002819787|nr:MULTISPECIES: hypothetical protein [Yersinia]AJI81717.1 hypothetical protein CH47_3441 [Yersinia enterocolitica]EKA25422.1 hypothetical Protein YWA314_19712 [Yersinia enterocolitica subsp. enterocolitica WA-314]KGA69484.1 hypothetical protein DJ59_2711 [Yersinia enterocolitica]CNJ93000.1 Uncharacterised protein [Yersinia enterocolitica]VFT01096.1 Uncharacterised protein [Yersinia enterocolitica]